MALKDVSLNDKYDLNASQVFISGTQAVVRLAMMQRERDRHAGHNTAGYVTGYRGSPVGGLDQQFQRAGRALDEHHVMFQPGINEDLAATALWGTQQAHLMGENKYDGVFGIWYGKGPGVDRSGDVFKHANLAGTAPVGGVIALMGDDHTCESSTLAHQSEFAFIDAMMPVLNPANIQELLDYGLYGWAMSRYASVWCGVKCIKDNIESTASIDGSADRLTIVTPDDFAMPPGGLNIRLGDPPLEQEERMHDFKRYAVLAFARANKIDRIVLSGGKTPKIGIATVGKSYSDVAQALHDLGIDEVKAANVGLRLFKIGMPWPVEPEGVKAFAEGLDQIIVVEEKRSLIETQIKEQLYGAANMPSIIGKRDEKDNRLFQANGALDPNEIAIAIGERLLKYADDPDLNARVGVIKQAQARLKSIAAIAGRTPYFCAGCPHNTSTRVPDGSRAMAGIGCHYMALWMDRSTYGFTQMGGEGANWIGEAPFSKRDHVFQNLGDGTYLHSGMLAIRAAIVAGTNITFKLLYNDAVAMTGGQILDGGLTVPQLARQVAAEGVARVAIVSDEPDKYPADAALPFGTAIHHRDDLDAVQRDLAKSEGVTVLIYDQTCAAEKRRRRKRGLYPDPPKRVVINELVCEGCGDCGVQSNCVAIAPVETEYGRKRAIDQSACNKDFSCLKGFCPSFVTVHGGELKKGAETKVTGGAQAPDPADLPEPALPEIAGTHSTVITGVGGTGVVTVGALLGMAAHLERKGAGIIDMAGLAQKGGAVAVHLRIGNKPEDIKAIRASADGADLILGCDMVVAASDKVLATVREGKTAVVANSHDMMTGDFTQNADLALPMDEMRLALEARAGRDRSRFVDAHRYAHTLLGDSIAANLFLLGFAFQLGHIPLKGSSIEEAIRLNGVAVDMNLEAFAWGRLAAHDPEAIEALVAPVVAQLPGERLSKDLDEALARRVRFLTGYQNAAYAERYRARVEAVRARESERVPGASDLADAVARGYFKLLAYKDEYEVARLYTDGAFQRQLDGLFKGDYRLEFHLAPPILAKTDPVTGRPRKRRFGPWMMRAFRLLAGLRGLRGTAFDIFGRTE
ncbi:MAG: indolepyruvate ferredoxin oxidoreductase family protein, partial [Hyphomicrobiales bacterium]|nr:indolepyruvate ferredoxin oxidoreductase family protein [Hyphomicrobiales bacterium]